MKVYLGSIGCRLNQSELEILAAELRAAGHEIVGDPEDAQAAVVNSCTVTVAAEADSRQLVHRLQRLGVQKIYLTGCWVSVNGLPGDLVSMEDVVIVPNSAKMDLAAVYFNNGKSIRQGKAARKPLPGKGRRTRAFIKVQEGCDYHCTFCITRIARGKSVSRPQIEIMGDIRSALEADVKEVVLTGTQLGGWGKDLPGEKNIAFLVGAILKQTDIPRLRLSSIEPWDITDDFFLFLTDARFCSHLHLPLQSGSAVTLKRMARKMPPFAFERLLERIRSFDPDIAITTDIVVGFPGESEEDFEESLQFVKKMEFAGGHIFRYSPRPGTPAAGYSDQIGGLEKRERYGRMRTVLKESASRYRSRFLGTTIPVLWERGRKAEKGGWLMDGLSSNYLRVQAEAVDNLWNTVSMVHLQDIQMKGFKGEIEIESL